MPESKKIVPEDGNWNTDTNQKPLQMAKTGPILETKIIVLKNLLANKEDIRKGFDP